MLEPSKHPNPAPTTGAPRWRADVARDPEEIRFALSPTAAGRVLVARSARGLCSVILGDDDDVLRRELRGRFPRAVLAEGGEGVEALAAEVAAFVDAPGRGLDVPLDPGGTEFQRTVWRALREIPAGETATYADVAARIGRPGSARAVGAACAANRLAVIIPCHRVVRSDGGLAGYRWGVRWKRLLLRAEAGA